jgi:SAM-dependent methyltransferase
VKTAPAAAPALKYFDAQAADYDRRSRTGLWRRLRAREQRAVLDALGDLGGRRVLEVGCGAGFYTRLLRATGATVVACDLSLPMLRATGLSGVFCADMTRLPLGPHFDVALCAGVLEFLPEPDPFLAEVAGCLRGRGRLVLLVPELTWAGRLYRRAHAAHDVAVRLFRKAELVARADAHGFTVRVVRRPTPFALVLGLERR